MNFSKRSAIESLRTCFNFDSDVLYGTPPHSHLLLVLLAMKIGAPWAWPAAWRKLFGSGGPVDMAAVAAKDASLAELLTLGLSMEVLS